MLKSQRGFSPIIIIVIISILVIVISLVYQKVNQNNSIKSAFLLPNTATNLGKQVIPSPESKITCGINISSVDQGDKVLRLVYLFEPNSSNTYVTDAQWDFNGDGKWDTLLSLYNGDVIHTFSPGTYTVKLRVKMSDGKITEPCSKLIKIPSEN